MKILVIDKLRRESEYRIDFWNVHRGRYANIEIDIPELGDGGVEKDLSEPIDLVAYQFILVHEADDKYTGYASDASKLGLQVVEYSDAYDEHSTRRQGENRLKMRGELLYSRLANILPVVEQSQVVDLLSLSGIDAELEPLFSELCMKLPLAEFWDGTSLNKRSELIRTVERKYDLKLK